MNILRRTACQTGDTVRNRVRVHKQQIAHKEFRMMGMSKHFSICGRNKTPDFLSPLLLYLPLQVRISERLWKKNFQEVQVKTEQSFSF